MDFFSKFTKPAEQSKPAASDGTEPASDTTDLFGSAKVVAGAAQSYFSHQPPTYENTELAGATADILGAASDYGKLDKTQGVGKYVDQAETYLKDYESSNTTTPPAAAAAAPPPADDAGVKSAPTTEAAETDTVSTKGADASTHEEPTKPESYGEEDTAEGFSSKPPAGDAAPVETDTTDVYGDDKADGLPSKTTGGGVATETDAGGDYSTEAVGGGGGGGGSITKTDVSDETTEEEIPKKPTAAIAHASDQDYAKDTEEDGISGFPVKPSSGGAAAEADSVNSGYAEDTEEGLPKPSAGGGDDASEKVSTAEGGFGNFTKVAGDFLHK
ncbi:uncharacterized protein [Henckelia pumila]|uniref:uncharacterized protein n=1 Tax=Henckelia pumila TaxID=405737 RepID=UPI003C6E71EB